DGVVLGVPHDADNLLAAVTVGQRSDAAPDWRLVGKELACGGLVDHDDARSARLVEWREAASLDERNLHRLEKRRRHAKTGRGIALARWIGAPLDVHASRESTAGHQGVVRPRHGAYPGDGAEVVADLFVGLRRFDAVVSVERWIHTKQQHVAGVESDV